MTRTRISFQSRSHLTTSLSIILFFLLTSFTSAQSVTFSGRQLASGGQYQVAADFNADGRVDLASVGLDLELLLGNGNGTFQPVRRFPIGTSTTGIVTGDFNNDARLDVAVSINDTREIGVFLGSGDGHFGPVARYATNAGGAAPTSVVAADFNVDGRMDLMTSDPFGCTSSCATYTTVTLFIGNGDGTFQAPRQINVGTPPQRLKLGDLNRDGIMDVVAPGAFGKVMILLGNGDSTFRQTSDLFLIQNVDNTDLVIHDFNRDGIQDLVVAADAESKYGVFPGNGDGTFRAPTIIVDTLAQRGAWLTLGDYNRDGLTDVGIGFSFCCPGTGAGAFGVMSSRGDGTFQTIRRYIVPNNGRIQLAALFPITADFNADGRPDVAAAYYCNMGGTTVGTIILTNTSGVSPRSLALGSLAISPSTTVGSTTVEGDISLAPGAVAPSGNLTFSVSNSNPSAASFAFDSISPPFFMVQGMTNLRFKINTRVVSTTQTATITARNNNLGSRSATLTVTPPAAPLALGSLQVSSGVFGGSDGGGQVSLETGHVAPPGGMTVFLTNDNPTLITSMPASVTIAAGQSTAGFTVQTWTTGTTTPVTFTASHNGVTKSAVMNVHAPSQNVPISSVTLSPTSIIGGANQVVQGIITLAANAPNEGATIMLSTNRPDVAVLPRSVRIFFSTENSTFVNFLTNPVSAPTEVTISAHFGDSTQSATLTVLPAPAGPSLSSLVLNPTTVTAGGSSQGTVTIGAPQSASTIVNLASSNSSLAFVPASVTILAGSTSANFAVGTASVSSSALVTITASFNGAARSATLTISPSTSSTDTVAIQRAEYESDKRTLRVEATSTRTNATMQVFVTSTGQLIGTLANDGGGRYGGELAWSVNPQNITVRSNFGGQASRTVTLK